MQIIHKIQCPNCGVTSNFKETAPNTYRCAYCDSSFEHTSSIPNKHSEAFFYEWFLNIYEDHVKLTSNLPKYHDRMLTGLVQMNEYLKGLKDSKFYSELFPKFENLVLREIEILKATGIHFSLDVLKAINKGQEISQLYGLGEYYRMLAYHQSQVTYTQERLEEALENIQKAIRIKNGIHRTYDIDLIQTKINILQRMGKGKEVYKYLYLLNTTPYDWEADNYDTEMVKDKEQLQYDFETIFLSEGFKNFTEQYNAT